MSISLSVAAFRIERAETHPFRARRFLHVADNTVNALDICNVRVDEQGDYPGLGNQFGEQLELLGYQLD